MDAQQERGFAESPFQYDCSFVSWGNVEPHSPNSNNASFDYNWGDINKQEPWYDGQVYGDTPGSELGTDLDIAHDVANLICGEKWRMPSDAEFMELIDNCDFVEADGITVIAAGTADKRVTVNGVVGIYLKSKINGNLLFFACSGYGVEVKWVNHGSSGLYWSSSIYSARAAYDLFFKNGVVNTQDFSTRYFGLPVRPVYDLSL